LAGTSVFSSGIEIVFSTGSRSSRPALRGAARDLFEPRSDPDSIARMMGLAISASGLGPRAMSIA
jgi:hypothetical protein